MTNEFSPDVAVVSPDGRWWFVDGELCSDSAVYVLYRMFGFDCWTFARFPRDGVLVLAFETDYEWDDYLCDSFGTEHGGILVLVEWHAGRPNLAGATRPRSRRACGALLFGRLRADPPRIRDSRHLGNTDPRRVPEPIALVRFRPEFLGSGEPPSRHIVRLGVYRYRKRARIGANG